MLMKETALSRCIATEMRWKRWIVSSGNSSVMTEMGLPMSLMASIACWFQEPAVSMVIVGIIINSGGSFGGDGDGGNAVVVVEVFF